MRSVRTLIIVAAAVTLIAAVPATASAFTIQSASGEQTANAYGLWYAGAGKCAATGCHPAISGTPTVHSEMVKNIPADPSKLTPSATSGMWPPPSGGGLAIQPSDIWLQVGDQFGLLEYIGSPTQNRVAITPSDDVPVWSPMGWEQEHGTGVWEPVTTPMTGKSYNQSCSGCHNLGLTRPSKQSYALPNGGTQTTSTPTAVNSLSIQCEVCHGTGESPSAHAPGVPQVVGGTQLLKAQVCGQCHVTGTAPQRNTSNAFFGNPNGYTPDEDLSAYLTPSTAVPTEAEFMNFIANGGTKPKFLPNGANYSMRHVYYNEWLINKAANGYGHAAPVNAKVGSGTDTKCLGCHSGLGFLNRIGAKLPSGSFIVTDAPTIDEAVAHDPGISCQVCHTGHVGFTASGYDLARKWGSGKKVGCEDCHNWQFEVLDQPLQTEVVKGLERTRPAADTRIRHPQREMVFGGNGGASGKGGLWGVAPAGRFMPDVECADCHMPRTHKEGMPADDDGSPMMTRMSHRFHVVMPGDAQRWKLRPNGDSCTPGCHEGEPSTWTRAQFQSWVEEIQGSVAIRSAEVTSALGVHAQDLGLTGWTSLIAIQPASSPASDLTPAEWQMLQKAAQNADFVINDASKGVHQPSYAMAGLRKALGWARSFRPTIDAELSSAPIGAGQSSAITGTLLSRDGDPIPGASVTLQQSADGGANWESVRSAAAGSGEFALPTGTIEGDRTFRVVYEPDAGVVYASDPVAVRVPATQLQSSPSAATSGWVSSNVIVTLTSTDPAAVTMYSLSGATVQTPQIYQGPFLITAEGPTSITFWSTSEAGTEAHHVATVAIDRCGPVTSSNAVTSYADIARVTASATDAGAGVASIAYSLDGSGWTTTPGNAANVPATSALGSHSLRMKATDTLGTVGATTTATFSVKTKPVLAGSPTGTRTVARGATVTLTASAKRKNGSAVGGKRIVLQRSTNGSSWSTYATLTTSSTGRASRSVRFSSRGTTYWRWYSAVDGKYLSAASAVTKVVAK
ncbi:MAG: chitobiase/beta-hexosaminidase C-terminal domain-containing protein [Coriobacteriales bacterium]|nr:chitobiase/beta-hexosaminidase C-terminal domain-containing protein [Coriobacteriales bacterium]